MNLRAEEERCSRLREELLTLREDMNKAYLSHDMLEQQKMESDDLIAQTEKSKGAIIIQCLFPLLSFLCYPFVHKMCLQNSTTISRTANVKKTYTIMSDLCILLNYIKVDNAELCKTITIH